MKYRNVGRTGLRVSEVSIGGWVTMGGTIEDSHSHAILREAIEHGINFIDLADVYARGEAERVAGAVVSEVRRSDLVISSKVYWPMSDNPNDRGLSRKHIIESCERSLQRLGTDYLDIYFCHRFDEHTPLEETVRAMDTLVQQGKVLYWGTSVWTADQLRSAHEIADDRGCFAPVVEQPRYNLFDRRIESEVMPTAQELGMGLVVWSPLAQGMLAGRYDEGVPENSRATTTRWLETRLTEENFAASRAFSALAREAGMEPSQLALAWLLTHEAVSSVITGASRPEQVRSNVRASDVVLDDELRARVEQIFEGIEWS